MNGQILVDVAGWAGSLLVVAVYALNISGRLQSGSPYYLWGNVLGSIGLIVNTMYVGAYPSAAVNIIWVAIAAWGLLRRGVLPSKG